MTKLRRLPLVAICGRPNVGKSTLFNRITGRQSAIVHKEEGITRDRFIVSAAWEGRRFRLVDTGGIVENPLDPITHKMQEQARAALEEATVILFVLDGQQEITRVDEEVCSELFRYGKPVVLAVNKLDNAKLEQNRTEFYSLGLGEPYAISASHNMGIDELMAAVLEHLPALPEGEAIEEPEGEGEASAEEEIITKVAVIGKPNVGKSSFINAILNEERTIVTDIPGTTRDALDIEFTWQDKEYLFIDTAGLRRKAGITREVERYSVARSLRSIRRADVCLIMMDATDGLSEQDKRICEYVRQQGTAMILVWTKWDLIEDKEAKFKSIASEMELKAPFLKYVPYVTISNLTRQRLFSIFEYIDRVAGMARFRVGTGELNRFVESLKQDLPTAMHKGKRAKILYVTQAGVRPTTFVLFVNQKRLFHFSYLRYIENQLREKYGFDGVPLTLEVREEKTERPARGPRTKRTESEEEEA